MQSFLQLVAHDLYAKIGNDLSRTVLIFPNKRANLFFNEYLAGESDQPIWSPAAMSISDLFQNEIQICRFYARLAFCRSKSFVAQAKRIV